MNRNLSDSLALQIISLTLLVLVAACIAAPTTVRSIDNENELNIVQLAESVKDLSTLVVAVVHANLTGVLSGTDASAYLASIVALTHSRRY